MERKGERKDTTVDKLIGESEWKLKKRERKCGFVGVIIISYSLLLQGKGWV